MRFQQLYYVLDTQYRILWVGGDWDEVALANAGDAARSNEVLSTLLMSHITDQPTADAVMRMVDAVRQTQSVLRIDYRGDSPTMLRRYQLTIQPMRDDRVLLVHDLRDAQTFPQPLLPWRFSTESRHQKCSFCCSVKATDGVWTPPEDLEEPHPEVVTYTICGGCGARVEEAIASLSDDRALQAHATGGFGP